MRRSVADRKKSSIMMCGTLILLLVLCTSDLYSTERTPEVDVTYKELQDLNITCYPHDTCSSIPPRSSDDLMSQNCNCGMFCAQLGTCCVDIYHRLIPAPKIKQSCRSFEESDLGYFMVDQCPQVGNSKSSYEEMCREDWDGQNDIMRLVPVTSLFSHITYKNYFCFRCNEASNDYYFWSVQVQFPRDTGAISEENSTELLSQLSYDSFYKTWVVPINKGTNLVAVNLNFLTPDQITALPKLCWVNTISSCSPDWKDEEIRAKCHSYMSLTDINRDDCTFRYRNPHCALCNFESLADATCRHKLPLGVPAAAPPRKSFSFALLLDINRSDGDLVGQTEKCTGNTMWDPFFKKCRPLRCALPGYVIKDRKCVAA